MSQIYGSLVAAHGSCGSTGTEVYGNGGLAANTGAGTYTITLDRAVDGVERSVQLTPRGTAPIFVASNTTSDTVIAVATFNSAGAAANAAFDWVVFQKAAT